MKRIAIAGSHGVGKTTLAYALAKSAGLGHTALCCHVARSLIKSGYPLGMDATAESYIQYIIAQLRAEQESGNYDLFISDRTLLDPLAYAMVNREVAQATVPDSIVELLMRTWVLEKRQYDLYIFVPIEFDMQSDGIRPEGTEYRKLINNKIRTLLDEFKTKYIIVSGTPDERYAQVIAALKGIGNE